MQTLPRILVVEDDRLIRSLLAAALSRESLHVDTANDGLHACELLKQFSYSVIIVDLMMPRMSGSELLEVLPEITSVHPVVIVLTAFDSGEATKLVGDNAHVILHKPFNLDRLVDVVKAAAKTHSETMQSEVPSDQASTGGPIKLVARNGEPC